MNIVGEDQSLWLICSSYLQKTSGCSFQSYYALLVKVKILFCFVNVFSLVSPLNNLKNSLKLCSENGTSQQCSPQCSPLSPSSLPSFCIITLHLHLATEKNVALLLLSKSSISCLDLHGLCPSPWHFFFIFSSFFCIFNFSLATRSLYQNIFTKTCLGLLSPSASDSFLSSPL